MRNLRRLAGAIALAASATRAVAASDPGLPSPAPDHTKAYVAGAFGLALTGVSFWLAEEADQAYADYLAGSDPALLEADFDRATRLDRISAAALVVGQASLALAIYWRFLAKSEPAGLTLARPAPRWTPLVTPNGVALQLRF